MNAGLGVRQQGRTEPVEPSSASALERLGQAERMLAEIASVHDAMGLIQLAEAVRVYERTTAARNHALEVQVVAECRLADLVDEGQARGEIARASDGRPRSVGSTDTSPSTYADLGLPRWRVSEARVLRDAFGPAELRRRIAAATERQTAAARSWFIKRGERILRERMASEPAPPREVPPPGAPDLRAGDLRELVLEEPVALILTDPPYPQRYLTEWEALADLAARVLMPGRLLVAYSGQFHLPRCMAALAARLEYVWLGALVTPGKHNQVHARHIRSAAKPLLFYSNGPHQPGPWFDDCWWSEERAKDHHAWEQSVGAAAYYIERLTEPGDLVVDPFLGSGSTAVAARDLGRRFIGCDVDPAALKTAQERLEEAA